MRGGKIVSIKRFLNAPEKRVLIVDGPSGVGKSMIVETAIAQLNLTLSLMDFSYRDDHGTLKHFLNSSLDITIDALPFWRRIFARHLAPKKVHIGVPSAVGVTIAYPSQAEQVSSDLPDSQSRAFFLASMTAGKYHLNAIKETRFFEKFWATHATHGQKTILRISNAEMMDESDHAHFNSLLRSLEPPWKLIIEIGTLTDQQTGGLTDRVRKVIRREHRKELTIENFDRAQSIKFAAEMERHGFSPASNFDLHSGNPFSMLFDHNREQKQYQSGLSVAGILGNDDPECDTFALLCVLFQHSKASQEVRQIAQKCSIELRLDRLLSSNIVKVKDDSIEVTHPRFVRHIRNSHFALYRKTALQVLSRTSERESRAYFLISLSR